MEDQKTKKYARLYAQLEGLIQRCFNPLARMATVNAVLYHKMDTFSWVGFYLLTEGELIVGPYQGFLACQVLQKNRGVCWTGINKRETIVVPDVRQFTGHIACDSNARSEIVIPIWNRDGEVTGVMDIDSHHTNNFDGIDSRELEKISKLIYR